MAAGLSAPADAYHPQLARLRQQLDGLIPGRAAAAAKEAVAAPSTLLDQVKANVPLLMELGSSLLSRARRSSAPVVARAADAAGIQRGPQPWVGRVGYMAPLLVIAVAAGAAYVLGRTHGSTRPNTVSARAARAGRQAARRAGARTA